MQAHVLLARLFSVLTSLQTHFDAAELTTAPSTSTPQKPPASAVFRQTQKPCLLSNAPSAQDTRVCRHCSFRREAGRHPSTFFCVFIFHGRLKQAKIFRARHSPENAVMTREYVGARLGLFHYSECCSPLTLCLPSIQAGRRPAPSATPRLYSL